MDAEREDGVGRAPSDVEPPWVRAKLTRAQRSELVEVWVVALVASAISLPVAPLFWAEYRRGNTQVLLGFVFVVAALVLLVRAVRVTARTLAARGTRVELAASGVLGGRLAGRVLFPCAFPRDGRATIELQAIREVSHEPPELLWSATVTVTREGSAPAQRGCAVEFDVRVPFDLPPTGTDDVGAEHRWSLEVTLTGARCRVVETVPVTVVSSRDGDPTQTVASLAGEQGGARERRLHGASSSGELRCTEPEQN